MDVTSDFKETVKKNSSIYYLIRQNNPVVCPYQLPTVGVDLTGKQAMQTVACASTCAAFCLSKNQSGGYILDLKCQHNRVIALDDSDVTENEQSNKPKSPIMGVIK